MVDDGSAVGLAYRFVADAGGVEVEAVASELEGLGGFGRKSAHLKHIRTVQRRAQAAGWRCANT